MQMLWNSSFFNRLLFNASKSYVRQLDKSRRYQTLQPVYALAILDNVYDTRTAEFYHHYRIVNDRNTEEVIEGLEFVIVELPKFKAETWPARRLAVLWLRFLREVEERNACIPDDLKENAEISEALELCEKGAYTEAELAAYEAYWDIVRVEESLIFDAESRGEAKGESRGKAIGEATGRKKTLIDIVLNCRRNEIPIEQMQALTGLNEEELQEILRSNFFTEER
jgi:predicted transposase/invertase (TIGR01784 family)